MNDKPIIFSSEMVRQILRGRKTMTRRIVNLPPRAYQVSYWTTPTGRAEQGYAAPGACYWIDDNVHIDPCPYGQVGDRLWVRETFTPNYFAEGHHAYLADGAIERPEWKSPIHMPRSASRILLEIIQIRIEKLQDITIQDCIDEGLVVTNENPEDYKFLRSLSENDRQYVKSAWDKLHRKSDEKWDANPYVWIVKFAVVSDGGKNIAWDKKHPDIYSKYKDPETVLCAAIWYKDLAGTDLRPYNVPFGTVIVGLHLAHVIDIYAALTNKATRGSGLHVQGFLTSHGRFVDREEGYRVAVAAKQLEHKEGSQAWLISEDLLMK